MKYINTLILLLTCTFTFKAQQYISLNKLQKDFRLNAFTLNPNVLYGVDGNIEIYNVYVGKNSILLLSVFPQYQAYQKAQNQLKPPMKKLKLKLDKHFSSDSSHSKKNKLNEYFELKWQPVDYKQIKGNILNKEQLLSLCFEWLHNNSPKKKTLQYKLVRKHKGKYYVSRIMLTELFTINETKPPFVSPYGSINIHESTLSIRQAKNIFQQQFGALQFPLDLRNNSRLNQLPIPYLVKFYLSKKFKINHQQAYQFWTMDNWRYIDGFNEYRGIDRFVYIPGKGIVGGSYDFYFELVLTRNGKISYDKLWNNIINEKVMIAEELK